MNLDYKQIGKNLARRRKELRLKQYEVCERAGINDKYLSCIETARSIPSLEVFLRLCEALETTPDHILLGSVCETDPTQSEAVLLEKFRSLSPKGQHLSLAFMNWIADELDCFYFTLPLYPCLQTGGCPFKNILQISCKFPVSVVR